jgi:hypothetical protein
VLLALVVLMAFLSLRRVGEGFFTRRTAPPSSEPPTVPYVASGWRRIPEAGKNSLIGEVGGAVWDETAKMFWVAGSLANDFDERQVTVTLENPTPTLNVGGVELPVFDKMGEVTSLLTAWSGVPPYKRQKVAVIAGYTAADDAGGVTALTLNTLLILPEIGRDDMRIRNAEGLTLLWAEGNRCLLLLVEGPPGGIFRVELGGFERGVFINVPYTPYTTKERARVVVRDGDESLAVVNDGLVMLGRSLNGSGVNFAGASDVTTLGYRGDVVALVHRNGQPSLTIERVPPVPVGRPAVIKVELGPTLGRELQGFEALAYHASTNRFLIMNEAGAYTFVQSPWPGGFRV